MFQRPVQYLTHVASVVIVLVSEIFVSVYGDKVKCLAKKQSNDRRASMKTSSRGVPTKSGGQHATSLFAWLLAELCGFVPAEGEGEMDMQNNSAFTGGMNPMFNVESGGNKPGLSAGAAQSIELNALRNEVLELKAENRTLRNVIEVRSKTWRIVFAVSSPMAWCPSRQPVLCEVRPRVM